MQSQPDRAPDLESRDNADERNWRHHQSGFASAQSDRRLSSTCCQWHAEDCPTGSQRVWFALSFSDVEEIEILV